MKKKISIHMSTNEKGRDYGFQVATIRNLIRSCSCLAGFQLLKMPGTFGRVSSFKTFSKRPGLEVTTKSILLLVLLLNGSLSLCWYRVRT